MKKDWRTYGSYLALAEGVGILSGILTREGQRRFQAYGVKPALNPPAVVFPIVWSILYGLMGFGAARVSLTVDEPGRAKALGLFFLQLAMNFAWSLVFFNLEAYGFALIWILVLWVVIAWMTRSFSKVDPAAGWSQVPYLMWVAFAAYLNARVWKGN